ncbi:MAG: FkbM family methyltransferase [Actinomycetes bacterium]
MRVRLPRPPDGSDLVASRREYLDVLGSRLTAVSRRLRRQGLGGHEPLTQASLLTIVQRLEPGAVFFDVGAHIGLYSALLSSVFEARGVRALSFEPTPDTAALARKLRDRNGLDYEVVETAVSSQVGRVTLHLSNRAETSNSLDPSFRPHSSSITVPMTTLDAVVRESGVRPSVIKIDVEAHESEVLRGGLDTIRAHRPWVVCEMLRHADDAALEATLSALTDAGFHLYKLTQSTPWPEVSPAHHRRAPGDRSRDWLFAPVGLDDGFYETFHAWREAVRACTAETNLFASASRAGG